MNRNLFSICTGATDLAARSLTLASVAGMLAVSASPLPAQTVSSTMHGGTPSHYAPASNASKPKDAGKYFHTNLEIVNLDFSRSTPQKAADGMPPYAGYTYETPASLACVYYLVQQQPGTHCNPNVVTANPTGGSQTIAIVDAYDDPFAASDLAYFSAQFGLPFSPKQFKVVYASGTQPIEDYTGGGWELEEALDIEYAHAMAPNAKIFLVEADSNSFDDLFAAVKVASNLVVCGKSACPNGGKGKGEVSMSWGGGEFYDEASYDGVFSTPGVVYVASIGDAPGVIYPGASPNVISAGGTSIARDPYTGDQKYEVTWADAGGGLSQVEPTPAYQKVVAGQLGGFRGTPDLSFDANPSTGVWVFNSYPYQGVDYGGSWFTVGGTSVSAPALTGIINAAGNFANSSAAELTTIYNHGNIKTAFRDTTYGFCGPSVSALATSGYDLCTGVGVPVGYAYK